MNAVTHTNCDKLCSQHSAMEEFKRVTEKAQDDQWKAIDGIKNAAWVSALSTIGTLVAVILTLLFDKFKISP